MHFDFLFTTSWSELDVETKVSWAVELEERGYDVCLLTVSDRWTDSVADGITKIVNLKLDPEHERCEAAIESEFDVPSARHLWQTERSYFDLSVEQSRRRTRQTAAALQNMFDRHTFEYGYQGRGGEIHRMLCYYMLQSRGRTCLWGEFSPFDGEIAFGTGMDGRWVNYETVEYRDIDPSDRESVEEYIEEFTDSKKVYSHGDQSDGTTFSPRKRLQELRESLDSDRPSNLSRKVRDRVSCRCNSFANTLLVMSLDESRRTIRQNEYVFFPLQFPAESRMTVFSPEFYRQEWIIEYLSRIVPANTDVFVKQHPNHPGEQGPRWIRNLRKNGNVRFLHPQFSAHEAIERASATVVTNNTVGFEALFYDTPLVVLGRAFYDGTPAATTVESLDRLDGILAELLGTATDREARVSSIHSLREASHDVDAPVLSDERAEKFADALTTAIQDL